MVVERGVNLVAVLLFTKVVLLVHLRFVERRDTLFADVLFEGGRLVMLVELSRVVSGRARRVMGVGRMVSFFRAAKNKRIIITTIPISFPILLLKQFLLKF